LAAEKVSVTEREVLMGERVLGNMQYGAERTREQAREQEQGKVGKQA
jgi:hypothetical protein